jgi:hypothetical protein
LLLLHTLLLLLLLLLYRLHHQNLPCWILTATTTSLAGITATFEPYPAAGL